MADVVRQLGESQAGLIVGASVQVPSHKVRPWTSISLFGAPNVIDTAIVDANIGTASNRSVVRLPASIRWLGGMWIRLNLQPPAGGTAYRAHAGINAVRGMRIMHGANVLCEWTDYPSVLRALIKHQHPGVGEAMLTALGGAAPPVGAITVCVAIATPWGAFTANQGEAAQYLPLWKASATDSPITIEIDWGLSANMAATPFVGNSVVSAVLVAQEHVYHDSARSLAEDPSPLGVLGNDFINMPRVVPGSGGAPALPYAGQAVSMLSLGGANVEEILVFSTNAVGGFQGAGLADFATSNLTVNGVRIDGRVFFQTTTASQAEHALLAAAYRIPRCEITADALQTENVAMVPFALYPAQFEAYTGGLPTYSLREFAALITTTDATELAVVAKATALIVLENGTFVRKRT